MNPNKPNWQPEILENDLLKIEPLLEADFDELFKVASDPLIWEQHPANNRYQLEVFKPFFDGAIAGKMALKMVDKASNTIFGSTRYYDYQPENSSIGIGFTFLARAYWGGKYNRPAKHLLIDYAFQFVDKVYFHIGATNVRSQLAIGKLGAVKTKEIDFETNGQLVPHVEYVIEKGNYLM
ncbi:MAG: GNAT family N-acetyltransferase [Flectobacillus sp.]|nr:GNAT family N-acetyltransferase [Flectobacillus sp.]